MLVWVSGPKYGDGRSKLNKPQRHVLQVDSMYKVGGSCIVGVEVGRIIVVDRVIVQLSNRCKDGFE